MVRLDAPQDGIRRYRLARLDEIAIASPPEEATTAAEATGEEKPDAEDDDLDLRSRRAA